MASQEYIDNLKAGLVSAERAKAKAEADLRFASTPARKAAAQRALTSAEAAITSVSAGIAAAQAESKNTGTPPTPTPAPEAPTPIPKPANNPIPPATPAPVPAAPPSNNPYAPAGNQGAASQEYLDNLNASLVSAERAKARAESDLRFASTPARKAAAQRTLDNANATITSLKEGIATTQKDLSNSSTSAGPGAANQDPAPPPASTDERLSTQQAATLAGEKETGTNPPVKPTTQTQSVSPDANSVIKEYVAANKEELNKSAGEFTTNDGAVASEYVRPGVAAGTIGAAAPGDDGTTAVNTTRILNSFSKKPFAPQPNVLDQYASYTYNIGWYLLTPETYTELQKNHKPVLSNYNLLVQSGGAQSDFGDTKNVSVGRNPFFKNDFYLDNLKIESVVTGKGSGLAHNSATLEFTVTEPANITLIENLWRAVQEQYKDSKVPYAAAMYALVIRFYGYDDNGEQAQAGNENALVEKVIPFRIAEINFTVSNKLVEYTVKGVAIPYLVGFGANLGVVKSNIEISGATVKDLLTSGVALAEVSPADGRKTSPSPNTYGSDSKTGNSTTNGITNIPGAGGTFSDGGLDTSDSLIGA